MRPDDRHGATELVRLADGALYWAKEHGRNDVALHARGRASCRPASAPSDWRTAALARAGAGPGDGRQGPVDAAHSERVAGSRAGWRRSGVAAEEVSAMRAAALVHDVGKIGVPDAILTKPGGLTPPEYAEIKEHAARGARSRARSLLSRPGRLDPPPPRAPRRRAATPTG